MERLVVTAIGDDRAGLVEALSGAIVAHGGNWEHSRMAELAGTFAGVVVAGVPSARADALVAAFDGIEASGLLHLTVRRGRPGVGETGDEGTETPTRFTLELVGQDHPGIVHEISHALAGVGVSIDELETEIVPAPLGGHLFKARAVLEAPPGVGIDDLQDTLEAVAHDLMVDLDLEAGTTI